MSYWILLPLGAFAGALIYMIWAGFKAKRASLAQKRRGGGIRTGIRCTAGPTEGMAQRLKNRTS